MSDIREMAIVFGHVVQHYGDPAKAVYEQHRIIEAQTAELDRIRAEVESLLAECRKQVLLEIIAEWEKPFVVEPEKFIDRLRRMAEGEKE